MRSKEGWRFQVRLASDCGIGLVPDSVQRCLYLAPSLTSNRCARQSQPAMAVCDVTSLWDFPRVLLVKNPREHPFRTSQHQSEGERKTGPTSLCHVLSELPCYHLEELYLERQSVNLQDVLVDSLDEETTIRQWFCTWWR